MLSIVAHGIMGTAYRQDVVVDRGAQENGCLQVLHDIRCQLSTQYGDDTPMTGWAMQPAPTGIWLSRIERAFDVNYAPAYIMVSFLIPQGKLVKLESLQCIEHSLVVSHMKYMQQSVVLHKPDWSFLHLLGSKLEGMLEDSTDTTPYQWKTSECCAYWPGDMPSMLSNMWNVQLCQFNIVYCGNRILSVDKNFVVVDDMLPSAANSSFAHDEPLTANAPAEYIDAQTIEEQSVTRNPESNTTNTSTNNPSYEVNPLSSEENALHYEPIEDLSLNGDVLSDDESGEPNKPDKPNERLDNLSGNDLYIETNELIDVGNDTIHSQRPNLPKKILITLIAMLIALAVGFAASVLLNVLIFFTPNIIGTTVAIAALAAATVMTSYCIGYKLFAKDRWPHKKLAIVVGLSLIAIIAVLFFSPITDIKNAALCVIYTLFSAMLSMLTYTLACIIFKHSELTHKVWVNRPCFILTFLWCMMWCCLIGILCLTPDLD